MCDSKTYHVDEPSVAPILAFREADGWTIADYKTDVGTDPDFPYREEAYRRQVELYATCWNHLTDELVKERIIFYTTQQREEVG